MKGREGGRGRDEGGGREGMVLSVVGGGHDRRFIRPPALFLDKRMKLNFHRNNWIKFNFPNRLAVKITLCWIKG